MKKFLRILVPVLSTIILVLVMSLISQKAQMKRAGVVCDEVDIVIRDSAKLDFIRAADVERYLNEDFGKWKGRKLDSLDLKAIETALSGRSAILDVEAYTTVYLQDDNPRGTLHIELSQREPIVLFMGKGMRSGFFADSQGVLFPQKKDKVQCLLTVGGEFPLELADYQGASPSAKSWVRDVVAMARYMDGDEFLRSAFSVVTSDRSGNLFLRPREGREKFLFGGPDLAEEKFERIKTYYRYILPAREKDTYATVDVRFEGQIVCREKEEAAKTK